LNDDDHDHDIPCLVRVFNEPNSSARLCHRRRIYEVQHGSPTGEGLEVELFRRFCLPSVFVLPSRHQFLSSVTKPAEQTTTGCCDYSSHSVDLESACGLTGETRTFQRYSYVRYRGELEYHTVLTITPKYEYQTQINPFD